MILLKSLTQTEWKHLHRTSALIPEPRIVMLMRWTKKKSVTSVIKLKILISRFIKTYRVTSFLLYIKKKEKWIKSHHAINNQKFAFTDTCFSFSGIHINVRSHFFLLYYVYNIIFKVSLNKSISLFVRYKKIIVDRLLIR